MIQTAEIIMPDGLDGTEATQIDMIGYKGYIATELQGHFYTWTQFGGFTLKFEADASYLWEP